MKSLLLAFASIVVISSCQLNNSPEQLAKLSDSTSVYGLTGDSVKLVKTAGLRYKVTNVEQGLKQLSALTAAHGGAVFHQSFSAAEEGHRELRLSTDSLLVISTMRPQADVTVRIPSPHLEAFLFGAADLGYRTTNSSLQVDDKSLAYLSNSLKADLRNEAVSHLSGTPKKITDTRQAITVADEAIDHLVAAKTIDADADYSTVNLTLFQNAIVQREIIANYSLDDYNLPFGQRMINALGAGWTVFLQFLVGLTHLWMFILLALVGVGIYKKRFLFK